MTTMQDVFLPDLGGLSKVSVIEILVTPGAPIQVDTPLLTLESDKATLEIPSPLAGVVGEIVVKIGDKVNTGDLLMRVAVEAVETSANTSKIATALPVTPPPPAPVPAITPPPRFPGEAAFTRPPIVARPSDYLGIKPHASPSVRRFARELGVDLAQVAGTGPNNRVLQDDIQRFVHSAMQQPRQAWADKTTGVAVKEQNTQCANCPLAQPINADFSRFGPVETLPLSRVRRLSGPHLYRSWITLPHVTQFDSADITNLEGFRQEHNKAITDRAARLSVLPFILRACANALKAIPVCNSSLSADGTELIVRRYVHIGIAVDTPTGLIVPVIRDVDKQSITQLATTIHNLIAKAKAGTLSPSEIQGGCFTISNLGGIGGETFTPIINAPEAAILGLSKAKTRPVWNGKEFVPRLMLPLALSYDHRIVDGADGARFTTLIGQLLGDIRRLLL